MDVFQLFYFFELLGVVIIETFEPIEDAIIYSAN